MDGSYVKSILKALRILDIFAYDDIADEGFSLSELSQRADIAPNTLCKILKTMVRAEYLAQDARRRYHSGYKASIKQLMFMPAQDVTNRIREVALSLSRNTGMQVVFTTLSFGQRKAVLTVRAEGCIAPFASSEAVPDHIYTKCTGRVMVSYASAQQFYDILEAQGLPYERWGDIDSLMTFAREREQVRAQGHCALYEPIDMFSVAVPVMSDATGFLGALGGTHLACNRPLKALEAEMTRQLCESAREILAVMRIYAN